MTETKTLTIPLEEEVPVGMPEFVFASYTPPTDLREIFVVNTAWPSLVRKIKEGANVYVHYAVRNKGTAEAGVGKIEVKDLDTDAIVATYTTPTLQPGERFKTTGGGAFVGKMPAKVAGWRLQFKITP